MKRHLLITIGLILLVGCAQTDPIGEREDSDGPGIREYLQAQQAAKARADSIELATYRAGAEAAREARRRALATEPPEGYYQLHDGSVHAIRRALQDSLRALTWQELRDCAAGYEQAGTMSEGGFR